MNTKNKLTQKEYGAFIKSFHKLFNVPINLFNVKYKEPYKIRDNVDIEYQYEIENDREGVYRLIIWLHNHDAGFLNDLHSKYRLPKLNLKYLNSEDQIIVNNYDGLSIYAVEATSDKLIIDFTLYIFAEKTFQLD